MFSPTYASDSSSLEVRPTPTPFKVQEQKKPQPPPKKVFDYPVNPEEVFISTEFHDYHLGIDLASNGEVEKPDILAIADGKVVYAQDTRYWFSPYGWGYGKLVVIEHKNGLQSLYAHLDNIQVKEGDKVKQGTVIGIMGSTGNSTGIHLHLEIITENELLLSWDKHNPSEIIELRKFIAMLRE